MPDGDNHPSIVQRLAFDATLSGRKYGDQDDVFRRHVSDMEYEDCANVDEKYSFPYTGGCRMQNTVTSDFFFSNFNIVDCDFVAEEDHCSSPYLSMLRNAELPSRKLSATHSPNLDLRRIANGGGNRSSMRSLDKTYDGGDLEVPTSLRSLDIGRDIHSSHSSIDRKRGVDEISLHSAGRPYESAYYDENGRYGGVGQPGMERDSRHGSDASLLLGATLPLQRRPFNASNEYGIANISESE